MVGERYVGQLCGAQSGLVTSFAASLAGLKVLCKMGQLSKRENWPEAKTRHAQRYLWRLAFILFALRQGKTSSTIVMLLLATPVLTGTR